MSLQSNAVSHWLGANLESNPGTTIKHATRKVLWNVLYIFCRICSDYTNVTKTQTRWLTLTTKVTQRSTSTLMSSRRLHVKKRRRSRKERRKNPRRRKSWNRHWNGKLWDWTKTERSEFYIMYLWLVVHALNELNAGLNKPALSSIKAWISN